MPSSFGKLDERTLREAEALSSVTRVWKFTAGHTGGKGFMDDFLNNERVALGYVYYDALRFVRTYQDLSRLRRRGNRQLSYNVQRQMWDFISMKKGNVVALKLKKEVVALGVVASAELVYDDSPLESKYFRGEQSYPNRKRVFWLSRFIPHPIEGKDFTKSFRYPQDTIHEITERFSKNKILAWVVWYDRHLATQKERDIIEQIGTIKTDEQKLPKRIQTTSEIAEKEYSALQKVIDYEEREERRKVVPVYHLSVGYDLESTSGKDTRYIEVKSRLGNFPVVLTETELKAAERLKNSYYLYVVTSDREMLRLPNPSGLRKKRLAHIVWELKEWSSKAERINV